MQPEHIVVVTCDREPPYVHRSLTSMLKDDAVELVHLVVCGGSDPGYLDQWKDDPRIIIEAPTDADRQLASKHNTEGRTNATTARALSHADGDHPVVLFEDDAACGKEWFKKARKAATTLAQAHNDRFLLALYAAYRLPRDKRLVKYHPSKFYGNVALWLAPATAVELSERVARSVIREPAPPCDMITKQMIGAGTPAYAHSPSIINHMGDQSTRGHFYVIRAQSYLG